MTESAVPRPQFQLRTRLSDDVALYLRELIMTGERRPGQLVNIDSFAREIGVSATPVREALMRLVSEGFLVAEQNRGFLVAPLNRQDVEDIFANHAQIGGELAARAARGATPEFTDELAGLQDEIERCMAKRDLAGADAANTRFHEAVIARAASTKLAWLFEIGVRYVPRSFFYPENPKAAKKAGKNHLSVDDHHVILDAMREQDQEKARAAMTTHITHASRILIDHLDGSGLWGEPAKAATPAKAAPRRRRAAAVRQPSQSPTR